MASRFLAHEVTEPREAEVLQNCKNTTGTSSTEQNPLDYHMYLRRFNRIIREVQNPLDFTGKPVELLGENERKSGSLRHFNNAMNCFTTGKQ